MNVEYIRLSDGTTAVTNENGIINKRKNDVSSNELFIENKIEVVNDDINQAKKKVNDYKGMVFLAKNMLISQPILFASASLLGYVFGNVSGLIYVISAGILVCVPATAMWGITLPISKRKLKGYEGKLEKAEELKSEYEKEIEKEKELIMQKEATINEPISLIQQNEHELPLIDEQLETAYSDAIHSKPKKLVLERKPSKRR